MKRHCPSNKRGRLTISGLTLALLEHFYPCLVSPGDLLQRPQVIPARRKGVGLCQTASNGGIGILRQGGSSQVGQQAPFPCAVQPEVWQPIVPEQSLFQIGERLPFPAIPARAAPSSRARAHVAFQLNRVTGSGSSARICSTWKK